MLFPYSSGAIFHYNFIEFIFKDEKHFFSIRIINSDSKMVDGAVKKHL